METETLSCVVLEGVCSVAGTTHDAIKCNGAIVCTEPLRIEITTIFEAFLHIDTSFPIAFREVWTVASACLEGSWPVVGSDVRNLVAALRKEEARPWTSHLKGLTCASARAAMSKSRQAIFMISMSSELCRGIVHTKNSCCDSCDFTPSPSLSHSE